MWSRDVASDGEAPDVSFVVDTDSGRLCPCGDLLDLDAIKGRNLRRLIYAVHINWAFVRGRYGGVFSDHAKTTLAEAVLSTGVDLAIDGQEQCVIATSGDLLDLQVVEEADRLVGNGLEGKLSVDLFGIGLFSRWLILLVLPHELSLE